MMGNSLKVDLFMVFWTATLQDPQSLENLIVYSLKLKALSQLLDVWGSQSLKV